ncbi:MAG: hydroxylamine reductase [Syntrophomonadaceae bacterium]|jgi:hydroxylamine reductase
MFCNQCEQTAKGGCTVRGVCGKSGDVAALQDLLGHALQSLASYVEKARPAGISLTEVDRHIYLAMFSVLTNVSFDPAQITALITKTVDLRDNLQARLKEAGISLDDVIAFEPAPTLAEMIKQGEELGLTIDRTADPDIRSLQEILLYGLRGIAAYAYHAAILGQENPEISAFMSSALVKLKKSKMELSAWVQLVLECGRINLLAMEVLDRGNTESFGHPTPTEVPLGHKAGKCILISGHDLQDLEDLLKVTEGTGILVYTHGEMLPAHGYPGLKKYAHLYGHYGTAWQNQKKEFDLFPGPILMTTNCIQEPADSYKDRIFTTGPVGWPGVKHLPRGCFGPIVESAQAMSGFAEDLAAKNIMVGFARQTVLGVADKVLEAVADGALRHIFLVGGCDGSRSKRSYYTEFVAQTPLDTLVLTLGCGKYRFFDQELGSIGGIPRLLDVGQCNDAYSAIQIAVALAGALNCGVNDLPLSLVLSWYEQKAVSILLTLLYLGIKDIRLGPTLPNFISPNVLKVLVENFDIKAVGEAEEDLQTILA